MEREPCPVSWLSDMLAGDAVSTKGDRSNSARVCLDHVPQGDSILQNQTQVILRKILLSQYSCRKPSGCYKKKCWKHTILPQGHLYFRSVDNFLVFYFNCESYRIVARDQLPTSDYVTPPLGAVSLHFNFQAIASKEFCYYLL